MNDGNIVDVNAKLFGNQLRESCFMALAMAVRAGENFNSSNRLTS